MLVALASSPPLAITSSNVGVLSKYSEQDFENLLEEGRKKGDLTDRTFRGQGGSNGTQKKPASMDAGFPRALLTLLFIESLLLH